MAIPVHQGHDAAAFQARARIAAANLIAEHSLSVGGDLDSLTHACALAWVVGYGAGTIDTMEEVTTTFRNLSDDLRSDGGGR